MNKSLVLVMCDVLVLSAMFLSTGNYERSGNDGCPNPLPGESTVQTGGGGPVTNDVNSLTGRISQLEYFLGRASNELCVASIDLLNLSNEFRKSTISLDKLSNMYEKVSGKYTNDVNSLTGRISQLEYFLGRASNELCVASIDLLNLSNEFRKSTISLDKLSNMYEKVSGKYTNDVNSLTGRISQLEYFLGRASNELCVASIDLLNLSNEFRKSTISLDKLSNMYEKVSGKYTNDVNSLTGRISQLEYFLGRASNELCVASIDLLNLSNEFRKSTISLDKLSNMYEKVSGKYTNDVNSLTGRISQLEYFLGRASNELCVASIDLLNLSNEFRKSTISASMLSNNYIVLSSRYRLLAHRQSPRVLVCISGQDVQDPTPPREARYFPASTVY